MLKFLSFFLKKKIYYKIRKTRFPFTINSYEIDIFYNNLWIEIIGIGIINNNILINNKLKTLGFAGGIGIDRLIMIKKSKKHIKYIYD
ncbi:putative phenylalanyl-tRNA synthetase alpha subunit [Candidatus Carsonella ruddii PV]|uniref:Putative phenylalanyl-tRNA synthetase alpha subunit n=1 Tax=Carsonella ruddii (strain PV) TaxID=387662 RepID=Q05FQ1_CARRP|nr:putative phenylalanyl-tRNA synthetase alpha subunit [Candidatus Carsonella ruddii PV]